LPRQVAFEHIADERDEPKLLAEHPVDVGGADIAAALGTHVDAGHLANEQPEGNCADQIAY
jgi:hypothetical protein